MVGAGVLTVKVTPLLTWPPTVTTTGPVVAPLGTVAVMLVAVQFDVVACTPLKVTVPLVPKLPPAIVTLVPTGPELGDTELMVGAGTVTVKLTLLLLACP